MPQMTALGGEARSARGRAHPNVALVKYWGKRDARLNLPSVGSISVTLDGLWTEVRVRESEADGDTYWVNGQPVIGEAAAQLFQNLEVLRAELGLGVRFCVEATSNFPVASGLASSASTGAALTVAVAAFCTRELSARELSILARRGSGSAARSIFGGFVEWHSGTASDGSDSFAEQLASPEAWPLGIVVAITDRQPKAVGSRAGMRHAQTSPFFAAWVTTQDADLAAARQAIAQRDLEHLGTVAEHNCLKMHGVALTAQPSLLYWKPGTLAAMDTVRGLRRRGILAYFTIDAGPQVKVLCHLRDCPTVADALRDTPGVLEVMCSQPGPGARVLEVVA